MIVFGAYTNGANQSLRHARILWSFLAGTVTADGTNGSYAANDYTAQRWTLNAGSQNWTLQTAANANIDCVVIAAHNLAGKTVTISTAATAGGAHTTRASIVPTDNSTIMALFNNAGVPHVVREYRVNVSDGTGIAVGIIRGGVALQMPVPIFGGFRPINLNRMTEARQQFSETGQWLGRTSQRKLIAATYEWEHLDAAWYLANFEPFAQTLPLSPFAIAGNPLRMPQDVAWGAVNRDVAPENTGVLAYQRAVLEVQGYAG